MNNSNDDVSSHSDGKSDLVRRLREQKMEEKEYSKNLGRKIGEEFVNDGEITYRLFIDLVNERQDCRGCEAWRNLNATLGEELKHQLQNIINNREREGDNLIYDDVALGFFDAICDTWEEVKEEVNS